jgi:hypothetical protein
MEKQARYSSAVQNSLQVLNKHRLPGSSVPEQIAEWEIVVTLCAVGSRAAVLTKISGGKDKVALVLN